MFYASIISFLSAFQKAYEIPNYRLNHQVQELSTPHKADRASMSPSRSPYTLFASVFPGLPSPKQETQVVPGNTDLGLEGATVVPSNTDL
jgi:hypothetical protein